ncbi:hypothetical protein OPV22_022034 [Ensete ventricosum]|uniref:Origin of replication complex subunit 4 n=1 Tax=Ensete ventricosum TaxID=4639 RepID=A0AAV8QPX6_ENSVE|nr:hypothetical protein OPV22_022034 [Ensete ventricosum]
MVVEKAPTLLRARLCDPTYVHAAFKSCPQSNYSKLKLLIASSIADAYNNSALLLGPRGSGKIAVVDLVLEDLKAEHPDTISVIRLSGLLHHDDNCAHKEIARQLCLEHQLQFSKMASSDDNSQFMIDMMRECGLAHKSIVFVLDEFDLFAQAYKGKQRLLYSLLDAMQTLTSQAVVIGVSCRLDADQLLEKRVRSRFSHRKLLFVPPSREDIKRLVEYILYLPQDSGLSSLMYRFESIKSLDGELLGHMNILNDTIFNRILDSLLDVDGTVSNLVQFLFRAVSFINLESGLLSLDNFKNAQICNQRQPKTDSLHVCMNKLERKEQDLYNFNSVMKEYKAIHDAYKTSDSYEHSVCLRAFEHLLERELIGFGEYKGRNLSIEFRPVKLLISPRELYLGLKSNSSCPAILQKLLDHESFK